MAPLCLAPSCYDVGCIGISVGLARIGEAFLDHLKMLVQQAHFDLGLVKP